MKIAQGSTLFDVAADYWAIQSKAQSPPEHAFATILTKAVVAGFLEGCGGPGCDLELHTQVAVAGLPYRLDFLLTVRVNLDPITRIAFEVDGLAYHGDQQVFARDRKRDRDLAVAGIETYRYTAKEITGHPHDVLAEVSRIVGAAMSRAFVASPIP